MTTERAKEVAHAYMRSTRSEEWPRNIEEASEALLPDKGDWALHEDSEVGLSVLATDGEALYKLAPVPTDERAGVTVSRLPIKGLPWRVRVDERADGVQLRQREWCFELDGAEELKLRTEERLAGSGLEPPDIERLERFARALARAAGWDSDSLIATDDE